MTKHRQTALVSLQIIATEMSSLLICFCSCCKLKMKQESGIVCFLYYIYLYTHLKVVTSNPGKRMATIPDQALEEVILPYVMHWSQITTISSTVLLQDGQERWTFWFYTTHKMSSKLSRSSLSWMRGYYLSICPALIKVSQEVTAAIKTLPTSEAELETSWKR